MRKRMFGVFAIVMFSITIASAQNWPQWRGPTLNGVSSEKNLPLRWTTEENIAWKLAMPGWSGSTPVIWRDRIFLNVADGNDLYLWCVDKTKGELVWKKLLGSGNVKMRKQNMSSPSPGHRRQERLCDDRHRHPQRLRLQRQRAMVAGHPEGLWRVWSQLGLCFVAVVVGRLALRSSAARNEDRRSVLRAADRWQEREDCLESGASDQRRA